MDTTLRFDKKQRVAFIESELTQGKTLAAVGRKLGISRERVRQIARQFGIPKFVRPRKPRKRYYVPVERNRKTGLTREEAEYRNRVVSECLAAGLPDPYKKFGAQRISAKRRGIKWEMNFHQWWEIWKDHYAERGVKKGQKVMCRHLDQGPYRPDNVRIDYATSNGHETRISRLYKSRRAEVPSKVKWGMDPFF